MGFSTLQLWQLGLQLLRQSLNVTTQPESNMSIVYLYDTDPTSVHEPCYILLSSPDTTFLQEPLCSQGISPGRLVMANTKEENQYSIFRRPSNRQRRPYSVFSKILLYLYLAKKIHGIPSTSKDLYGSCRLHLRTFKARSPQLHLPEQQQHRRNQCHPGQPGAVKDESHRRQSQTKAAETLQLADLRMSTDFL